MSYIRFMNSTNPLWDFIAEMGGQDQQPRDGEHFDRRHHGHHGGPRGFHAGPGGPFDSDEEMMHHGAWDQAMPHRTRGGNGGRGRGGRHGPGGRHHRGPPPPPEDNGDRSATMQAGEAPINLLDNEDNDAPAPDPEISAPADDGAYSSGEDHPRRGGRGGRRNWHRDQQAHPFGGRHHGRGGMRGPGGARMSWGPGGMSRGPEGMAWGPRHHHPYHPHGHRRRGSGPPPPGAGGPFAPFAHMFGMDASSFDPERLREAFAEALQNAATSVHPRGNRGMNGNETGDEEETGNQRDAADFKPAADIYDATDAYIVHFALPGAKKEDINLNWDAEKSELNISGVIAREGDEEVMKTLALDERDVGVFERRVKLGREGVEADGITAKMENGLLVVRVPKKATEDEWTEVMKVDIE